jgi:hypothetical protein
MDRAALMALADARQSGGETVAQMCEFGLDRKE